MKEIDFELVESFHLESGEDIRPLKLRCSVFGRLNEDKTNAVLVYHALSGSSRIRDWWDGVLGSGLGLNTDTHAFICVNYPGSCYGSTSAREVKRKTGKIPLITAGDVVRANSLLFEFLGIERFDSVVGASVGGMLALRHAVDYPHSVKRVIAVGASPLTPLGLALNHLQRQAVSGGDLELARKIALLTYKSSTLLERRFSRRPNRDGDDPFGSIEGRFDVSGYLDFQAKQFSRRFEGESYVAITKMMDLFDLSDEDMSRISATVDLVGISSDWLFPPESIRSFAKRLSGLGINTHYHELDSEGGHDAFLTEPEKVNQIFNNLDKTAALRTAV